MPPTPLQGQFHQPARHREIHHLVDHVEKQGDQEAGADIVYVQFRAQRRRAVPYDCLRDAVNPDGLMSERILQQADQRSGEQPGHRASPRHRKKNHHQQGQVEERKEVQTRGQKSL